MAIMKRIRFIFVFIALVLIAFSCNKNDKDVVTGEKVELYLIASFSTIEGSQQKIDENSVVTQNNPLIYYTDLLSYNPNDYTFKLTDKAVAAINNVEHSVWGVPFAIKADNEVVYTGYFWPNISSASCNWIVIDPMMIDMKNEIKVKIGYPGPFEDLPVPDKRNDERIIRILKADNKLK